MTACNQYKHRRSDQFCRSDQVPALPASEMTITPSDSNTYRKGCLSNGFISTQCELMQQIYIIEIYIVVSGSPGRGIGELNRGSRTGRH